MAVVQNASRRVREIAVQSTSFLREREAIALEYFPPLPRLHELREPRRGRLVLCPRQDDPALFQSGKRVEWDGPVAPLVPQRRRQGQGQGNDADVGAARLDELRRLGNVLAENESL